MITIRHKPISVNQCRQGQRFKTKAYKVRCDEMMQKLPNDLHIEGSELHITIERGFSSKASDIDNPTKAMLDILQKKYQFNDKSIFEMVLKKRIVPKGDEYIKFDIKKI